MGLFFLPTSRLFVRIRRARAPPTIRALVPGTYLVYTIRSGTGYDQFVHCVRIYVCVHAVSTSVLLYSRNNG